MIKNGIPPPLGAEAGFPVSCLEPVLYAFDHLLMFQTGPSFVGFSRSPLRDVRYMRYVGFWNSGTVGTCLTIWASAAFVAANSFAGTSWWFALTKSRSTFWSQYPWLLSC